MWVGDAGECVFKSRGNMYASGRQMTVPLQTAVLSILGQHLFKGKDGGSVESLSLELCPTCIPHPQSKALTPF